VGWHHAGFPGVSGAKQQKVNMEVNFLLFLRFSGAKNALKTRKSIKKPGF
jgi:hypothetical protein